MYHGTLTWTKLILKFCYFPVNVPDTLSGKLRYTVKKTSKKSCKIPQTSKTPTAMIKELAAVFLTV